MLKNTIQLILVMLICFTIYSCDTEKCPEGSVAITDFNGDTIDCTDVPNFNAKKQKYPKG